MPKTGGISTTMMISRVNISSIWMTYVYEVLYSFEMTYVYEVLYLALTEQNIILNFHLPHIKYAFCVISISF